LALEDSEAGLTLFTDSASPLFRDGRRDVSANNLPSFLDTDFLVCSFSFFGWLGEFSPISPKTGRCVELAECLASKVYWAADGCREALANRFFAKNDFLFCAYC
jgi:hypothetical protein